MRSMLSSLLPLTLILLFLALPALGETLILQPGSEAKDTKIGCYISEEEYPRYFEMWTFTGDLLMFNNLNIYNYAELSETGVYYKIHEGVDFWYKTLIELDISALPPDAVVQRATLKLYNVYAFGEPTGVINVLGVTEPWDEYQVNWNNQPTTFNEVFATSGWPAQDTWCSFDITQLVKGCQEGRFPNYGLMIVQSAITKDGGVCFASSDDPIAEHHPRLIIEYETIPGEE